MPQSQIHNVPPRKRHQFVLVLRGTFTANGKDIPRRRMVYLPPDKTLDVEAQTDGQIAVFARRDP